MTGAMTVDLIKGGWHRAIERSNTVGIHVHLGISRSHSRLTLKLSRSLGLPSYCLPKKYHILRVGAGLELLNVGRHCQLVFPPTTKQTKGQFPHWL